MSQILKSIGLLFIKDFQHGAPKCRDFCHPYFLAFFNIFGIVNKKLFLPLLLRAIIEKEFECVDPIVTVETFGGCSKCEEEEFGEAKEKINNYCIVFDQEVPQLII